MLQHSVGLTMYTVYMCLVAIFGSKQQFLGDRKTLLSVKSPCLKHNSCVFVVSPFVATDRCFLGDSEITIFAGEIISNHHCCS